MRAWATGIATANSIKAPRWITVHGHSPRRFLIPTKTDAIRIEHCTGIGTCQ
jgi:hypothetical protein